MADLELVIKINEDTYKAIQRRVANPKMIDKVDIAIANGTPLNRIRAEIEKVFCMSVVTNELRTPMEVKTEILQIIDEYREVRE